MDGADAPRSGENVAVSALRLVTREFNQGDTTGVLWDIRLSSGNSTVNGIS